VSHDPATGAVYAAGGNAWYGPAVWRTRDRGQTWTHSSQGLGYGEGGPTIPSVWAVTAAHGRLLAGVEPAGLFRSDDHGDTWSHVRGLREHPSSAKWVPGGGGLILHAIVAHPEDPRRLWVAISTGGTYATEDGGETWAPRNQGVRADFLPETYPEVGQCVHGLVTAAGRPDWLYQQNHCGMYRSRDAGRRWEEVSAGLPSTFGFPIAAHPRDPQTFYLAPLNGDDKGRFMPEGRAAIWRTGDGGGSWTRLTAGLPREHAYLGVLRRALCTDRLDPAGVYVGTSTGQLFWSRDEGDSWEALGAFLPPIRSVEAAVLDD
jgi:photosystem II stability/assembly factor-like uncharacterized protein